MESKRKSMGMREEYKTTDEEEKEIAIRKRRGGGASEQRRGGKNQRKHLHNQKKKGERRARGEDGTKRPGKKIGDRNHSMLSEAKRVGIIEQGGPSKRGREKPSVVSYGGGGLKKRDTLVRKRWGIYKAK